MVRLKVLLKSEHRSWQKLQPKGNTHSIHSQYHEQAMNDTEEILKRLDRIERHLNTKPKKTWVKVSVIQQLTGWDARFLEKARINGLVTQRKGANGIEYLLESIHPNFLK